MGDVLSYLTAIVTAIASLNPYVVLVWGLSLGVAFVVIEGAGGMDRASTAAKEIAICAAVVSVASGLWWVLALVFALIAAIGAS